MWAGEHAGDVHQGRGWASPRRCVVLMHNLSVMTSPEGPTWRDEVCGHAYPRQLHPSASRTPCGWAESSRCEISRRWTPRQSQLTHIWRSHELAFRLSLHACTRTQNGSKVCRRYTARRMCIETHMSPNRAGWLTHGVSHARNEVTCPKRTRTANHWFSGRKS